MTWHLFNTFPTSKLKFVQAFHCVKAKTVKLVRYSGNCPNLKKKKKKKILGSKLLGLFPFPLINIYINMRMMIFFGGLLC